MCPAPLPRRSCRSERARRAPLPRSFTATAAALLVALPASALQVGSSEELEALEQLQRAEEEVAKGFHKRAVSRYERLADKFPETPAGRIAGQRIQPNAYIGSSDLLRHGPSANRVDVVVMGDGYTLDQQDPFDDLARVVPDLFERNETLGAYFGYFNFIRANVVSAEAGVDGFGREYDTALGSFTRGTIQGHVGLNPSEVRDVLALMPEHDGLAIAFVKRGILGTGYPGVAVIGGRQDPTTIHEWGHSFGGLADEYAQTTGHRAIVPHRINVSAVEDESQVPWRHFLEEKVPGVGVYEGANGQVRGAWKPTNHCLMDSGRFFCPVCREAMVLAIYALVDPIESCEPPDHPAYPFPRTELSGPGSRPESTPNAARVLRGAEPHELTVRMMRPETHPLEIRWWVLPERAVPEPPRPNSRRGRGDRRDRGPLNPILLEPVKELEHSTHDEHTFRFDPSDVESGRYRVVCRVTDSTQARGEKFPWVLSDPDGLLSSERGWWIVVD